MGNQKQKKSEIVSDMMRGALIIKAISDALRDRGGDDSSLVKVLGEKSVFPGIIADLLMERGANTSFPFLLAYDLIPEYTDEHGTTKKWEMVDDVKSSDLKVSDIEMVAFLEKGEAYVSGEVMCNRALALKANMGLADAKRMLDNEKEDIPAAWRGKFLVFTGTKLRSRGGDLCVPLLYFDGDRWCLNFRGVRNDWNDSSRLLRCK